MDYDVIIIGQGLAGSTLAWSLLTRGARVLVVDRQPDANASSVAAGLVTPVTGRALGQAANYERDFRVARGLYADVEKAVGEPLWYERPALRLFPTVEDAQRLEQRRAALGSVLGPADPPPADGFRPFAAAALMTRAARLDVKRFVHAIGELLVNNDAHLIESVEPQQIQPNAGGVAITSLKQSARYVVCCGGSADEHNPWLADLKLSPAKGEILTVRIDDFGETRTTHSRGHWLLPCAQRGVYRFGATYDHHDTTPAPTSKARTVLRDALAQLVDRPFEVLDQQAGLRPVGPGRQVVVGAHPAQPAVILFNGLGSRGVLWAPWQAEQLAEQLLGDGPVTTLQARGA